MVTWGTATMAYWAFQRERKNKSSHIQISIALLLLPITLYLLVIPEVKALSFFYHFTFQGAVAGVIMLLVWGGYFLYRKYKIFGWGLLKVLSIGALSLFLLLWALQRYESYHWVAKLATASEEDYPSLNLSFKRYKYAQDHEQFIRKHPKIAAHHIPKMSVHQLEYPLPYRYDCDSLYIAEIEPFFHITLYTTTYGIDIISDQFFFYGKEGTLSNGKFVLYRSELDPFIRDAENLASYRERGEKIYREESVALKLVEPGIDAYINYRETIGTTDKKYSVYADVQYLDALHIPFHIPTTDESNAEEKIKYKNGWRGVRY